MKKRLKIGWLFPNTLSLHGERGNILAIKKEGERLGYTLEVDEITLDTLAFNPLNYDFLFAASGEMVHFKEIINFLTPQKENLLTFIKSRPFLVTGTSIGLFGEKIHRLERDDIKGLGLLEIESYENKAVYGDDLYYSCDYHGKKMSIVGIQIQMMDIDIKKESAFGTLIYGYGNNGKTKMEGIQKDYGIFTNTLAPLLVCNPWLTEEILQLIQKNQGIEIRSEKKDTSLEEKSFETKTRYILNKTTHLTNHLPKA